MKYGQLIGCNARTIFLEKSYTKCDGEAIPSLKSYTVFLLNAKLRTIEIY